MPVPLRPENFDAWLTNELGANALKPAAEAALREWPVSKRLNRTGTGDDDPTIIEPAHATPNSSVAYVEASMDAQKLDLVRIILLAQVPSITQVGVFHSFSERFDQKQQTHRGMVGHDSLAAQEPPG